MNDIKAVKQKDKVMNEGSPHLGIGNVYLSVWTEKTHR